MAETRVSGGGFVEYRPGGGAWPVVLSAPHGGALTPAAIPDRTAGVRCVTLSQPAGFELGVKPESRSPSS